MSEFLTEEEINDLIAKAKTGDNIAWQKLYDNYERYVHNCVWKRLWKMEMADSYYKDMEEDLFMAGWDGFVNAIRNHDPGKGKFLTYATYYINGEITKELQLLLNPLGLKNRPKYVRDREESRDNGSNREESRDSGCNREGSGNITKVSLETIPEIATPLQTHEKELSVPEAPDRGTYSIERRVLQIMEVLRRQTDEDHSITKSELGNLLRLYRIGRYDNGTPLEDPRTLTDTMIDILQELDPMEYSENREAEYKIRYNGYKEDRLKQRLNLESEKENKEKGSKKESGKAGSKKGGKKAPSITGFSYVHTFSNAELDQLMQLISFSDMLSLDEKTKLIRKLMGTASEYYHSPFWDGEGVRFHPQGIYGRFSGRTQQDRQQFAENIKQIQNAVNHLWQIRFRFNQYTEGHEMIPKSEYMHALSPYHLVVYHDNYYCIGLKTGAGTDDKRIWHYRVDLMSDIEINRDPDGKPIPIEVYNFAGLPIANSAWNPETYMAEHLNMAYDEPQDIKIKIRNTDYTILHDWFGDHYKKVEELVQTDENGREATYDIVLVRTSPYMIVHWAMQYGTNVEIMNEEIREKIREEIRKVGERYGDQRI